MFFNKDLTKTTLANSENLFNLICNTSQMKITIFEAVLITLICILSAPVAFSGLNQFINILSLSFRNYKALIGWFFNFYYTRIFNTEYFPFDLKITSFSLSITVLSSIIILLFVIKRLTVFQKSLLFIIPFFVASSKLDFLAFLLQELRLLLTFLKARKFFLECHFRYLFYNLDLFIISLLNFLVIKWT